MNVQSKQQSVPVTPAHTSGKIINCISFTHEDARIVNNIVAIMVWTVEFSLQRCFSQETITVHGKTFEEENIHCEEWKMVIRWKTFVVACL